MQHSSVLKRLLFCRAFSYVGDFLDKASRRSGIAKELLVLEKKQVTSTSELCDGLPTEEYMIYVRNLRYEDQPDYRHLREMFKKLFRRQAFEYDDIFDWTLQEFQRLETETQEPLASNDVGERLGAETTKPSDDGSQDVAKARRRKGDDILSMESSHMHRKWWSAAPRVY
ncbi:hypothetical protein H2202_010927 [Exophiala xenobiotica]|nr:hypothetical protein H2202_010927 [Exophiala xenobiotica]